MINSPAKKAYIFRGAPASGKGTITKLFMQNLPGKVALLELDTFRWEFHSHIRKIQDITDEEHRFAYENFLLMLERYCQNGQYTLVIEGLFSWDTDSPHGNMQDILKILHTYKFTCFPFVLSAGEESLWKRNEEREYVVPRKEFDALYHNVMHKIGEEERVIDVTNHTPEETLKAIQSVS